MKPGRSDVELRQLRAFLAVADELHFGRAAERLHIGQSPLSQTIRALERELGTDLFVRTTRSVQLTTAGEALVTPARIIEAQIAVVREIASAASTGETGRVTVGFGGTGGYTVLSALSPWPTPIRESNWNYGRRCTRVRCSTLSDAEHWTWA